MPTTDSVIEEALKQRPAVRRLFRDCRNVGGNGPDYLSGGTHNEIGWKATVDMEAIHAEIDPLSQTYRVFATRSYGASNAVNCTDNSLLHYQN